jgi:hypothetical protein
MLHFYIISKVTELLNSHVDKLNKPKIEEGLYIGIIYLFCVLLLRLLALNTEAIFC